MFTFPKIPAWNALHPFIVHFPIALLFTAPILIIIALIWTDKSRTMFIAAFIIMLCGTIACYVAAVSGDAASHEVEKNKPSIELVLNTHEELAETARGVFTALTLLFFIFLFAPSMMNKEMKKNLASIICIFFLVLYGLGCIILLNAAHSGGILVHQLGVRALW